MSDPSYPTFPVFSFLAFLLVLIPLPWHFQAWNSGTCLYMIWTALGCLNYFINSIIWHDNAIDWAPIWCDISTRFTVGLAVALPAASLCINRRLYKIASIQTVATSRAHKRRAIMIDLAIGLGIPFVQMALQFVVQGHRYDIWEDIGCLPTTFNTPPAYPLSFLWPIAIGLVSAMYCILTLRAFLRRRAQFSEFLSANSSLTTNRYFRLMSLATIELIFNTPMSAYGIYLNVTASEIQPWKGWSNAHFDWYIIDTFPAILWRSNTRTVVTLELTRWSVILCALVFFGFFGFADEARKNYRLAFRAVTKRFGILPFGGSGASSHSFGTKNSMFRAPVANTIGSLPVYIPRLQPSSPSRRYSFSSTVCPTSEHTSSSSHSPTLPEFKLDLKNAFVLPTPDIPPSPRHSHVIAKPSTYVS